MHDLADGSNTTSTAVAGPGQALSRVQGAWRGWLQGYLDMIGVGNLPAPIKIPN